MAGVGAAGTAMFAVFALTQMLGVGTVALMSHAVGRKDRGDANHIFNQSVALSALCAAVTLAGGFGLARTYMQWIGADAPTMAAGVTYLYWFTPGLALQFALVAMSSALRGTGIVRPSMIVQAVTVLLNIILAPVLIAGWGTGHPLGVAGAGLASTVAIAAGVVLMAIYFLRLEKYVEFDLSQWRPQFGTWRRILNIGLPAGGEFALMAIFSGVVYWIIRDFGAAAQAAFGIGTRVMQAIFLPAMAIAFAAAPIAGQNFGAKHAARVRETFRAAAFMSCAIMAVLTLDLPVGGVVAHSRLHERSRGDQGRGRVSADHLLELRGCRDRIYLLQPVPGAREYVAVSFEQRVAPAAVRGPGGLALVAVRIRARRHLASLGGDRRDAGDPQPAVAAVAAPRAPRPVSPPRIPELLAQGGIA